MKKLLLFVPVFLLMISHIMAQNYSVDGTTMYEFRNEFAMYDGKKFPSVRPYLLGELAGQSAETKEHDQYSLLESHFFPMLSAGRKVKFMTRIEPYLETSADLNNSNLMMSHSAIGLSSLVAGRAVLFHGSFRIGTMNPLELADRYVDSMSVLPGLGMVAANDVSSHYYILPQIRLNAKLSPMLSAETGMATHFFGEGKRSLILSDEHYSYPYLKFTTDIWKLRYVNLFAWHRDVQSTAAQRWSDGISKFTAMHYLSWNVTKRLNVSVFEAVVAPLHDSLMQRQFVEYNYLLPVVMYRPVDFALGSPDNVLVGMNLSLRLWKKHIIYGQLVFDEMFFNEVKADVLQFVLPDSGSKHGAWVNKQAFQLGWKYYDMFGLEHLDGLLEFNVIRPYTYSHRDVQQNYTHLNQPLAHPYGANLTELTGRLRYASQKWFACIDLSYIRTGIDSTGTHFGHDIFKPTFDAPIAGLGNIPVQYYGNTIGQGIPYTILYLKASLSRVLIPKYNIHAEAACTFRKQTIQQDTQYATYVHFAMKYGIGNERKGN